MKAKIVSRILLWVFLLSFLPFPTAHVSAQGNIPPADFFQLPWEQGIGWYTLDGFDNGFKRGPLSPHLYWNGGALDFTPRLDIQPGDDTSNDWVTAAAAGTVIERGICHLMIDHGNGWTTEYQFLANFQVSLGDRVYRNQRLGVIADGVNDPFCPPALYPDVPHVHFELRPTMNGASFAGWLIGYDPILNKTSYTRNDQTLVGLYQYLMNTPDLLVISRGLLVWNTIYEGSIDAYRYEEWTLQLNETTTFSLTANALTSGLLADVVLLDMYGNEITRGSGALTSTQPAGTYYVQIQPREGQGFYTIVLENEGVITEPYILVQTPGILERGHPTPIDLFLGNIPAEGYSSVEITCPFDAALLDFGNMSASTLFGSEPVTTIHEGQANEVIFAIAGSNGQRTQGSDGVVMTVDLTGLSVGQTFLECTARISTGTGTLSDILAIGAAISILEGTEPPTPTPTPAPTPTILNGKVLATKPVTLNLYTLDHLLVRSLTANTDGSFSMEVPSGSYMITASAEGFLGAQGSAILYGGQTTNKATISLLAGDIDGNAVIDQFDALTIGMSYNTSSPAAADLNADGIINVLDLEMLAANYRANGIQNWD